MADRITPELRAAMIDAFGDVAGSVGIGTRMSAARKEAIRARCASEINRLRRAAPCEVPPPSPSPPPPPPPPADELVLPQPTGTGTPRPLTEIAVNATGGVYSGHDPYSFIRGVQDVLIVNFEMGPQDNVYNALRGVADGDREVQRVRLENGAVHGIHRRPNSTNPDPHTDGLWISGANDITIRNVDFYDNSIVDLALRDYPRAVRRIVIEDCWFGLPEQSDSWYAIDVSAAVELIVIRRSAFARGIIFRGDGPTVAHLYDNTWRQPPKMESGRVITAAEPWVTTWRGNATLATAGAR